MKYDFIIKNGHVIDTARGIDQVADVYISNSKIVEGPADGNAEADEVVDASGKYVFPGLIDFHSHLGYRGSDIGLNTDLYYLPNGVTASVDAGSAGPGNLEFMVHDVIQRSAITMKCFMNVASSGMITEQYFEDLHPEFYDIKRMEYLFELYRDYVLGFKVRIGRAFSKELNLIPLKAALELGEQFDYPICCHITNPESSYDEMMPLFRKNDILCHYTQKQGEHSILEEDGTLRTVVKEARERGVIFDYAAGRRNHSLAVLRKALEQGFGPDVISTDVVTHSIYRRSVFALPYTMSELLAAGLPITDVLRAVTETPARLMHLEGTIGTLKPGANADVAIMDLMEKPMTFRDQVGNEMDANHLFVPMMTFRAGRIAYRRIDFTF